MSTVILTFRSPRPWPRCRGRPMRLIRRIMPDWDPGGTAIQAGPCSAGTVAVLPSTASGTWMCRSCQRSAPCRGEGGIGLGADDHVRVAGLTAGGGAWPSAPCKPQRRAFGLPLPHARPAVRLQFLNEAIILWDHPVVGRAS